MNPPESPRILAKRGPTYWLAWVSDAPANVYKGRSAQEAIGRLFIHLGHRRDLFPRAATVEGFPFLLTSQPESEKEGKRLRAETEDWALHPYWKDRRKPKQTA